MQRAQEFRPEGLGLRGADAQADDLTAAFGVRRHCDYGRDRHDPSVLTDLEVGGVQPEIGLLPGQWAVQELAHALVNFPQQL